MVIGRAKPAIVRVLAVVAERLPPSGTSFNGSNGSDPYGGLTLSSDGSKLFGSCNALGGGGVGDVFSVPVSGGSPTLLGNFNGSNGANPYGGLTLIGANLYGTTSSGGTYHDGVVYSVPVGGGVITVLASFDGPDGADPMAGLTLSSDGTTLFGTTAEGGQYGDGEVFSVPVGGGTLGIVASFDSTDGQEPWAGLTLSPDGSTLYGSTLFGGANNDGVVFSVPAVRGTPAGPPAAPEPRSALLLVTGLVLFSARCRKRRSSRSGERPPNCPAPIDPRPISACERGHERRKGSKAGRPMGEALQKPFSQRSTSCPQRFA